MTLPTRPDRTDPKAPERPVLELSGPRITRSFETLVTSCEDHGGVEAYIAGLAFKASLFKEVLGPDRIDDLDEDAFTGLCAFMAPVRRRVGAWLATGEGFPALKERLRALLGSTVAGADVDGAVQTFCDGFPEDRDHRWVRDLAAEVLHYSDPERHPLMTRWVWDRKANTGVLREIWHAENVDHITIDMPDGRETFLVLREELSKYLSDNGVFRDMVFYVDLLLAQIYADYICEQGGSFLRTDFVSEIDPMAYTRRMLGLDGVDTETGKTRVKLADGARHGLGDMDWVH